MPDPYRNPTGQAITAQLIVRRVKNLSPQGQGELFHLWRYHAAFTDSLVPMLPAEERHRAHAQAEQVFADWTGGPLAHLSSGSFPPTPPGSRSPRSAATCYAPPGPWPASSTPKPAVSPCAATSSTSLRPARRGRGHLTLQLPEVWHREHEWRTLFHAATGPPAAAA